MAFCGPGSMGDRALSEQDKVTREWDGMAGEWDDIAADYARGFYRLLRKQTGLQDPKLIAAAEADSSSSKPFDVVVDFGCGTGLLTNHLRHVANKVIAMDASPQMIEVLQDKIQSREWDNVKAYCVVLSNLEDEKNSSLKQEMEELYGTVDLIVASSVMSFIPKNDLPTTMSVLGQLLKSKTGIFCHSDWPKSEAKHPDAMDEASAQNLYALAGLQPESTTIVNMNAVDGDPGDASNDDASALEVFFGVAKKP